MAYGIVQNVTGGDATGTSFATFTLTIAAIGSGNAGMGWVQWYQGGGGSNSVSVKFGSNNALVPLLLSGDGQYLASFHLENITAAPTTVVFTFSGGSTSQARWFSINFTEVSGGLASLDQSTIQYQSIDVAIDLGATDRISSGNVTPTVSGDFLFPGILVTNPGANSFTVGAGTNYTLNNDNTVNGNSAANTAQELLDEYGTYNSTAAVAGTFTATVTAAIGGSSSFITGIMAFTTWVPYNPWPQRAPLLAQ
jgi:hypothetical protein